jgi:hypothetical protein
MYYTSSQKLVGLRPDEMNERFQFTLSFGPHYALRFTRPLTEMSTRNRKIMFLGSGVEEVV